MDIEKIGVVGLGYVGLTLSLALSQRGCFVKGSESDIQVREQLKRGDPQFFEKNLKKFLENSLESKKFEIVNHINGGCDSYILCVGTPLDNEKKPNLKIIENAANELKNYLKNDPLVVIRSTIPIGTTEKTIIPILEQDGKKCGRDFSLTYAPERTLEGKAMEELFSNSQIIGGYDERSVMRASNLFRKITPTIINVSSIKAAEAIKLLDNTSRDFSFAFVNLFATLCEEGGLDAYEIIRSANIHYPRNNLPLPSPGVGGACLTKDPHILTYSFPTAKNLDLILSMRDFNQGIPRRIVQRIGKHLGHVKKDIHDSYFFLSGFAFKGNPETDDMRNSTSLWFLDELRKFTVHIKGYDPIIKNQDLEKLGIEVVNNYEQGFDGTDCAIFLNNHNSYSNIDIVSLSKRMNQPAIIFDSWRLLDNKIREVNGIDYMGVGL